MSYEPSMTLALTINFKDNVFTKRLPYMFIYSYLF